MTLYKALGLPPSFRAKAMNPKFRRASDWLPTNQASVDKLAKLSLASSCWLTAGTVTVIAARLEGLAPKLVAPALEARGQLLDLQRNGGRGKDRFPRFFEAEPLSEDVKSNAELAMVRAINLARRIAQTAAHREDLGNIPYRVEGLHIGVCWLLWGQSAAWAYRDWRKHALRVVAANDKRDGGRKGFGLGIPSRAFDVKVPVNAAAFVDVLANAEPVKATGKATPKRAARAKRS